MRKALLIAVLALAVATPAEAGQTAAKCEANKLKTTAKYGDCLFKALSKAAKKKAPEADYTKCDSKFVSKWAKIETKGGCIAIAEFTNIMDSALVHFENVKTLPPLAADIAVGGRHTCAIDTSGAIECWGRHPASLPTGVFTQVSAGSAYSCAIDTWGSLHCWGDCSFGYSCQPPAGTFNQVSVGGNHACAIDTTGSVHCWGRNKYGQSNPPPGTFMAVGAGTRCTCLIDTTGALDCFGLDHDGIDGIMNVPSGTFVQVDTSGFSACAIESTGALSCWGKYGTYSVPGTFTNVSMANSPCMINSAGALECVSERTYGQVDAELFTPFPGTFAHLDTRTLHLCAIDSLGAIRCFGKGECGDQSPWNNFGQSCPPLLWRCWTKPMRFVGKYGSCRLTAEAKAVKRATLPDYSRCDTKFTEQWARTIAKNGGSCPAIADLKSAFQTEAVTYADDIAALLASQ